MSDTILAVFDLDKTLTNGRSLESLFMGFLARRRRIPLRGLFLSLLFYLKHVWRDPVTAAKRNKLYLKGTVPRDVAFWVDEFIERQGGEVLIREGEGLVRRHKALGHTTVLVTGSLDILVRPLMRRLNSPFDRIYSTTLEVRNGLFTGRILGAHYYGDEKAVLVDRVAVELGGNLDRSFCYADSKSDLAMMSRFGHPIAVNSDKALRRKAVEMRWKILDLM